MSGQAEKRKHMETERRRRKILPRSSDLSGYLEDDDDADHDESTFSLSRIKGSRSSSKRRQDDDGEDRIRDAKRGASKRARKEVPLNLDFMFINPHDSRFL